MSHEKPKYIFSVYYGAAGWFILLCVVFISDQRNRVCGGRDGLHCGVAFVLPASHGVVGADYREHRAVPVFPQGKGHAGTPHDLCR